MINRFGMFKIKKSSFGIPSFPANHAFARSIHIEKKETPLRLAASPDAPSGSKMIVLNMKPSPQEEDKLFRDNAYEMVKQVLAGHPNHLALIVTATTVIRRKGENSSKGSLYPGHMHLLGVDETGGIGVELSKRPGDAIYQAEVIPYKAGNNKDLPIPEKIKVFSTKWTSTKGEIIPWASVVTNNPASHFQHNGLPIAIALVPFKELNLSYEEFEHHVDDYKKRESNRPYLLATVKSPSGGVLGFDNCISAVSRFIAEIGKLDYFKVEDELGHSPTTGWGSLVTGAIVFEQVSWRSALIDSGLVDEHESAAEAEYCP